MKIVIAPDKFRGTLSAVEVCHTINKAIKAVDSSIDTVLLPLADGGEGTLEILTFLCGGRFVSVRAKDPLFREIEAQYGLSGDEKTAFVEMARVSGIQLLGKNEINANYTTTFGTGQIILDAIHHGVNSIILGIGGSATNDGGIGMAAALGYQFNDGEGQEVLPVGKNLHHIQSIDDDQLKFVPGKIKVRVACDVSSPMTGKNGAAYMYGKQKGLDMADIQKLDQGLKHLAVIIKEKYGRDIDKIPGSGASGGLGGGTAAFLHAELESGIDLILNYIHFKEHIKDADLIITGEGKIDKQTFRGKVIHGVIQHAKTNDVPVIAFCGINDLDDNEMKNAGLNSIHALYTHHVSMRRARRESQKKLEKISSLVLHERITKGLSE